MSLPGNTHHQQILQTILDHYADDNRILAVLLFGSLGRGNWDDYSDLDLDIAMADDASLNAAVELKRLCLAIKRTHELDAIIIADPDEGDVVLSNLVKFSIRYHPLHDTKPAILDTMMLMTGTLSLEEIREAGEANRVDYEPDLEELVSQCIRCVVEVHSAIMRVRLWMALELLHRLRFLLMEVFSVTHGGVRALQFFEENASDYLSERMKAILPSPDMSSVRTALGEAIDLIERDLDDFSNGEYQLTSQQRTILQRLDQILSRE